MWPLPWTQQSLPQQLCRWYDTLPYRWKYSLTDITWKLFACFANNQMKVNHHKYHLILCTQNKAKVEIKNVTMKSSSAKKILGITVDNKLRFDKQYKTFVKTQGEN